MSLAEIKRLHALVLAGKNAATERDDKIRALAGANVCPRCDGHGTLPIVGLPTCPECGGNGCPPTQTAIATELGVSRQAIGQIVGKTG